MLFSPISMNRMPMISVTNEPAFHRRIDPDCTFGGREGRGEHNSV